MSDFMALLMYQQNERELEIALERRRLQKEAMAAKMPARRASGGWHRFLAGTSRPATSVRSSFRAG
ncbi:hypothetical protein ACT3TS_03470 [Specibacter sp. AOP5-B1-6]|uniref:hypothetical protein n=1 Tax=Specibacter sp. AOP5-B1-6 TaxID=3457653 RepID=UPI00402B1868